MRRRCVSTRTSTNTRGWTLVQANRGHAGARHYRCTFGGHPRFRRRFFTCVQSVDDSSLPFEQLSVHTPRNFQRHLLCWYASDGDRLSVFLRAARSSLRGKGLSDDGPATSCTHDFGARRLRDCGMGRVRVDAGAGGRHSVQRFTLPFDQLRPGRHQRPAVPRHHGEPRQPVDVVRHSPSAAVVVCELGGIRAHVLPADRRALCTTTRSPTRSSRARIAGCRKTSRRASIP